MTTLKILADNTENFDSADASPNMFLHLTNKYDIRYKEGQ